MGAISHLEACKIGVSPFLHAQVILKADFVNDHTEMFTIPSLLSAPQTPKPQKTEGVQQKWFSKGFPS